VCCGSGTLIAQFWSSIWDAAAGAVGDKHLTANCSAGLDVFTSRLLRPSFRRSPNYEKGIILEDRDQFQSGYERRFNAH